MLAERAAWPQTTAIRAGLIGGAPNPGGIDPSAGTGVPPYPGQGTAIVPLHRTIWERSRTEDSHEQRTSEHASGRRSAAPVSAYDPKTQWRVYREQQKAAWRAQRDAWKAQRHAWKAGYGGAYGPRVPSIVGPVILIAVGVVALADRHRAHLRRASSGRGTAAGGRCC